jgi:hypothetical protein
MCTRKTAKTFENFRAAGGRDGDHHGVLELGAGKHLEQTLLHLVDLCLALVGGQHVDLVEHHDDLVHQDFSHHEALGCLRLDPLE